MLHYKMAFTGTPANNLASSFQGGNVGVFLNIFCIKRLPRIYAQVKVRIKSPNNTDYNLY